MAAAARVPQRLCGQSRIRRRRRRQARELAQARVARRPCSRAAMRTTASRTASSTSRSSATSSRSAISRRNVRQRRECRRVLHEGAAADDRGSLSRPVRQPRQVDHQRPSVRCRARLDGVHSARRQPDVPDPLLNARDHAAFLFYENDPGVPVPRANDTEYVRTRAHAARVGMVEFDIDDLTAGKRRT